MKRFKVISPKGFAFGGKQLKQGETFTGARYQGHITTGLHFGQIKEIEGEAEAEAKKAQEKEQAEAKAKEEADAKAKAEAEAKKGSK